MNHEEQKKKKKKKKKRKKKNMYMIIYSLFFPMNTRAICLPTKTHYIKDQNDNKTRRNQSDRPKDNT